MRATVTKHAPAPAPTGKAAAREAEPAGGALATGWSFSSLAPTARAALAEAGRPLDGSTRRTMEATLGQDLSAVRVHDGARAAAAAGDAHADAFALGQDLVFGRGRYAPSTDAGRGLLVHELAHTIQQRGARTAAPPLEPGSPLEERARAATGHLGVSGLALASAAASPEYFDDAELTEQIAKYTEKLKNPSYPGRSGDADWLERCKSAQRQRASVKASEAAAAQRPRKPASHRRTAAQERAAAVREAESVAVGMAVEEVRSSVEDSDDDLEPTPMALPEPGKRKAAPKPAAKPKPKPKPKRAPSKFDPGGFTDKDIYGATDADLKRIDAESGPAKDPRHFEQRLAEARGKTPMPALVDDFAGQVFDYGLANGLFAEHERNLVIDTIQGPRRKRQHQENEHEKMMVQYRKEQEFENFRSQLNLMFIQAALMGGPKAPPLVQFGYAAYSGAETGKAIGTAVNTGDPVDIGNALIPLAGGVAFHTVVGGGRGGPPPEEPPSRIPPPEEVTADQVRAQYGAEPDAVKKNLSNDFHQRVWEQLGGEGPAPRYFRAGRVLQVNELQWEGDIAEINQPHELTGQGRAPADPAATSPTLPGAQGDTLPGEQPAQRVPDPQPAQEQQPDPNAPGPNGTLPSAPGAPPPARPGVRQPPPAVEASVADAADAFRANPNTVFGSSTSNWHDQIWMLSRGAGESPPIYRSGRVFIIDLTRLSDAERAEIGL